MGSKDIKSFNNKTNDNDFRNKHFKKELVSKQEHVPTHHSIYKPHALKKKGKGNKGYCLSYFAHRMNIHIKQERYNI